MPSSIHSFHSYGARSTTSIATSIRSRKSAKKVKLRWWERRPLIKNAVFTDLQKGSYLAAIYALVESLFQIGVAIFDVYCLYEAAPGSTHFRSFGISFLFVYSGNRYIRGSLMFASLLLFAMAIYLLISTLILMAALRKEHEIKFVHWLRAMGIFVVGRMVILIYQSTANDLYFGYHQAMLVIWLLFTALNVFAFCVVYSNYQELSDITRLEDMAKLKMSTLSSLNASRSLSHHSLDYGGGSVSSQPSPQVQHHGIHGYHTPRGSTSSAASFNIQPSPRTGHITIPMTCYNPNGQPSPRSHLTSTSRSTPSTAPV